MVKRSSMTPIEYIHHCLWRDYGTRSVDIRLRMDEQFLQYLNSKEADSEVEGFQYLLNQLIYPILALQDSMDLEEVDLEISRKYVHRIWEEMPVAIRKDVMERSAEMTTKTELQTFLKMMESPLCGL